MTPKIDYNQTAEGVVELTIKEGDFDGVTYSYGKVWFPDSDSPILSFNYDLKTEVKWTPMQCKTFEKLIGDLLQELLTAAMKEEALIFKGGTDENRRTNIVQPADERSIFTGGDSFS